MLLHCKFQSSANKQLELLVLPPERIIYRQLQRDQLCINLEISAEEGAYKQVNIKMVGAVRHTSPTSVPIQMIVPIKNETMDQP